MRLNEFKRVVPRETTLNCAFLKPNFEIDFLVNVHGVTLRVNQSAEPAKRVLTLPPKYVSLAQCFNANKENRDGKDSASEQNVAASIRLLGLVDQTLFNWVKADRLGKLKGIDTDVVSAAQMENSRPCAELMRVKMKRDILRTWRLRLATHLARAAGPWHSSGQGPRPEAHAVARHQGQRQAPLQGYDRPPPQPAYRG